MSMDIRQAVSKMPLTFESIAYVFTTSLPTASFFPVITVVQLPGKTHLAKARQRLVARERSVLCRDADLQCQAAADAQMIVDLIVRNYHPKRVFQWGSLLRPGGFKSYSDIDIAIEGVTDAERFFALQGEALAISRFPLDIVQLEKIAAEYADDIRRHGKMVYERE